MIKITLKHHLNPSSALGHTLRIGGASFGTDSAHYRSCNVWATLLMQSDFINSDFGLKQLVRPQAQHKILL